MLLLGAEDGSVATFDVRAAIDCPFSGDGHSARVNDVCSGAVEGSVFSGSADGTVCQWSLASKTAAEKWRADDSAVSAVCRGPSENLLATAGSAVKLWDIEAKTELKRFTGHASAVSCLLEAPGGYVLSAVYGRADDTLVYAWPLTEKATKPQAALALPAACVTVGAAASVLADDGSFRVVATTEDGSAYIFSCPGGKRQKKPVESVGSIKMTTGDLPAVSVRVLAAAFAPKHSDTRLVLARGSSAAPRFEELRYTDEGSRDCSNLELVREVTGGQLLTHNTPTKSKAGGSGQESTIVSGTGRSARGQKQLLVASGGKSLAEQVEELGLAQEADAVPAAAPATGAPRAGSLAHMLAQALHSNDNALLEECLNNTNEAVVRNTVSRLPPQLAVQFLIDVVHKLEARPSRGVMLMSWIRAVLLIHSSYLMTVPDLPEVLSGMYSLVDTRLSVFPRLLKLSGRLDLLLSQIALKSNSTSEIDAEELQVPGVAYQEEDSEDESDDDDAMSNGEWEDADEDDNSGSGGNDDEDYDDDDDDDSQNDDDDDDDDDDAMED